MSEIPSQNNENSREEKTGELKRKTGIDKLVGFSQGEEREVSEFLENQKFNFPERQKTPEEIKIIKNILIKMPWFIEKYGGTAFNFLEEKIHFLSDDSDLKHTRTQSGFHDAIKSSIVIFDSNNVLLNTNIIVHELIHANSFQSVELSKESKEGRIGIDTRRTGFEVHGRKNRKEYFFTDINEAVIEVLVKRFDKEYFQSIPELSERVKEREEFIANALKNRPQDTDKLEDIASVELKQLDSGEFKASIFSYTRVKEREQLNNLIKDIYQKNQDQFSSTEDVFNIFAKAIMNGKILEVARLVEKTYGKGSFRKLGEQTKGAERE